MGKVKKNDLILIGGILFLSLLLFLANILFIRKEGNVAVITVDGKEYKRVSLSEDTVIEIADGAKGYNKIVIKDGQADMIEADCPDLLCVHQKAARYQGETIVCLPNKVVVEIQGGKKGTEIDAVAN